MQKWTVRQDGPLWLVLHNGNEVSRSNSEAGAWANANRRANTTAAKRGVESALIGDEIVVAGGSTSSQNWQASRRQRHQAAATKAGFDSIDKLANAINEDRVRIVRD
jgi:hypothetical protein